MNNHREDQSLLEVREWKEQCRQEDEGLTPSAYLERIKAIAESIKSNYHIKLQKVSLSH